MNTRIILVGCGNMGFAMLQGWLKAGEAQAGEVLVVEPAEGLRARAAALGVAVAADAGGLPADAKPELAVIAVKPQVIRGVLEDYRRFGGGGTTFLSVAAGTSIATFEEILGAGTPVIRCMPNTPAAIGKGMMATVANAHVTDAARTRTEALLAASGAVAALEDEALIDAVTAVSGSGPAYVFLFIECLARAGEAAGLPPAVAAQLAKQTVYGAGALAYESADPPAELRRQVTSPNGTTAAALVVLMAEDGLQPLVTSAVEAARARSVELGKA